MAGWGRSPLPLAPRSLRAEHAATPLPSALASLLGLPPTATFAALGPDIWSHLGRTTLTSDISVRLVTYCLSRIDDTTPLVTPDAAAVRLEDLPWSTRARQGLAAGGFFDEPERLASIGWRDLLQRRNLGKRTILEIVTVLDWAASNDPDPFGLEAAGPLEDVLRRLFESLTGTSGVRLNAILRRFGADGRPAATLAATGATIGVSRERVRQIESAVRTRIASRQWSCGRLDEAVAILTAAAPCTTGAATARLRARGVTATAFDPATLLDLARLFGHTPDVEVTPDGRVCRIGGHDTDALIRRVARGQAGGSGASSIHAVLDELRADSHPDVTPAEVRAALDAWTDFEWLTGAWFWYRGSLTRNRLRNITRRMLSVQPELAVSEIRRGVLHAVKHKRTRGRTYASGLGAVIPPRAVMALFYERHPEFAIDASGRVRATVPLNHRRELGFTEQVLVEAIRACPDGVACLGDLRAVLCGPGGLGRPALEMCLYNSPVIVPEGGGLFRVIGDDRPHRRQ